jgi:hypothetical protein
MEDNLKCHDHVKRLVSDGQWLKSFDALRDPCRGRVDCVVRFLKKCALREPWYVTIESGVMMAKMTANEPENSKTAIDCGPQQALGKWLALAPGLQCAFGFLDNLREHQKV